MIARCFVCSLPVPKGRRRFCSDVCLRKQTNVTRRGRFNIDILRVKTDGRRKVTDAMRQDIKNFHALGWSMRKLARRFEITPATVKAVLEPLWYAEKQRKHYAKHPWLDYYDKEKHRLAMRAIRAKKRAGG